MSIKWFAQVNNYCKSVGIDASYIQTKWNNLLYPGSEFGWCQGVSITIMWPHAFQAGMYQEKLKKIDKKMKLLQVYTFVLGSWWKYILIYLS